MEQDFTITESAIKEIIKDKLPKWFSEKLSSDYSNPLKDAVEEAIKQQDGVIKKLVDEVLSDILLNDEFKKEIGRMTLSAIVKKGLNN